MRRLAVAVLLCVAFTGCTRYVEVKQQVPVIQVDQKPNLQIPDDMSNLSAREGKLVNSISIAAEYADQLKAAIDAYNEYAEDNNAEVAKQLEELQGESNISTGDTAGTE